MNKSNEEKNYTSLLYSTVLAKLTEPVIYIKTHDPSYFPASVKQVEELKEILTELGQRIKKNPILSVPTLLNPAVRPLSYNKPVSISKKKLQINEDLKHKFDRLLKQWKNDTRFISSVFEMAILPAYQQIIGMGPDVIPLILQQLTVEPDHWFWALKAITGEDPVPEKLRGNIKEMTNAWLQWGQKQGYEC